MIAPLAYPTLAQILRTPRLWMGLTAWCALVLALAVAARSAGSLRGADYVLSGVYGALVVPFVAYLLVGAVLGGRSLRASTEPLASFGAAPARVAAVTVLVTAGACALLCAALGSVVALVAHGAADPPPVRDAIASGYAGALGGGAYATWLSLGASFGRRGGGRFVWLAIDWLLGANQGAAALFTPRGHLRNLLGDAPPMDLSERASAAALLALAAVCTFLASRRAE
jgi:hypothetical protein